MRNIAEIGSHIDLQNIIIHKLNKVVGGETTLKCASDVLPITDIEKKFVGRVTESYQKKSSPTYGIFDDDAPNFKDELSQLIKNEIPFRDFTKRAMNLYKRVIKHIASATGAFMVFAHYKNLNNSCFYMLVLAINNKPGYIVQDTLTLKSAKNIDFSKIDLACNINLTKWGQVLNGEQTDSKTYLSFVKGKKDISDYFMKQFIGCDNKQTNEEASIQLVRALEAYCKSRGLSSDQIIEIKHKAFSYCQDRMNNRSEIPLDGLSAIIDGDNPRDFTEFASQEEYSVSAMISGNKQILRRLERIRYKEPNMHIEFEQSLLGNTVIYDRKENTLTFKELPDSLTAQLF